VVLSVVVRWGPFRTAVNGTLVARLGAIPRTTVHLGSHRSLMGEAGPRCVPWRWRGAEGVAATSQLAK
jgi:hypothetical protein